MPGLGRLKQLPIAEALRASSSAWSPQPGSHSVAEFVTWQVESPTDVLSGETAEQHAFFEPSLKNHATSLSPHSNH